MSFNIFDFPRDSDITVGYIDPTLGYVNDVSICDANEYAKKNPGTTFIFETRDGIRYLNINEVNKLTPKDLASSANTCTGVEVEGTNDSPSTIFYGGGGVGAAGNPIFGKDGSLLAVDLISGGFGYQYPPLVEIRDQSGLGVGAVTRAILVGDPDYSDCKYVDTEEVFDQEDDFEDYQICDPVDAAYGRRYDADGNDIGEWDPTLYGTLSQDPIAREIQKYQDFLQELQTPWWTTRKQNPLRVTSGNRTTRIKHDVQHPGWGGDYDQNVNGEDFKQVTFNVFTSGAQNKGLAIKFTSADKTHTFKIKADDFKNDETGQKVVKSVKINTIYTVSSEGSFRNSGTEKGIINKLGRDAKEVNPRGKEIVVTGNKIFADFLETTNDNDDLQVEATLGTFTSKQVGKGSSRSNFDLKYELKDNSSYTKPSRVDDSFMNKYAISPVPPSNAPGSDFAGDEFTIEWEENFPYEGEYIFRGMADNLGRFYLDNEKLFESVEFRKDKTPSTLKKTVKAGVHRIRVDLYNAPTLQNSQARPRKIFDTIQYINKADRKLWRLDPRAGRDADFLNQYGILPIDPNSSRAQSESFAGTYLIRWENVEFPVDGNYNIEVMVDDNVTLYIGNRSSGGDKNIGNGLRSINNGGDEVIIRKSGFSGQGRSTGKSTETRFFKAGKYRIRAELEQIKGKPLSGGNPMALAINIEATSVEQNVVSSKSWNENPMGAAMTIDAPTPPIPQEPIPIQEGRCPRSPIWTTRFPGGKDKWWPVKLDDRWSRFMNRFAISPIPPLSQDGSDGGGVVYQNSWQVDIPYDGFYALKGTVDNGGRILVDNRQINGLEHFKNENPKSTKFFLSKGVHTITVEVENEKTDSFERINKKVFSTKDWLLPPPAAVPSATTDLKILYNGLNSSNNPLNVKGNEIRLKDGSGNDTNATFSIVSSDPGVKASFSSDGKRIEYNGSGKIKIRLQWNDNPSTAGVAVKSISVGGVTLTQNGSSGTDTKTITVNQRVSAPTTTNKSQSIDGVVYEGPTAIANYKGDFISPVLKNVNAFPNEEIQGKTWIFRWSNVDFPIDSQYTLEFEADDDLVVKIDGVKIGTTRFSEGRRKITFNATKGKKKIELELFNLRIPNTGFALNPTVAFAQITVPVDVSTGIGRPWTINPVGISAVLIPPPCPKKVTGKGVVCRVIVDDPGNGFPVTEGPGYPAALRLRSVEVENPGINYNCGVDQIQISPSNGAQLSYECDTFGRITKVNVLNPGFGFTEYPEITMITPPFDDFGAPLQPTGVNARFRPQFEIVRDPVVVDPEVIIQVTDLVGLKQTGYVDGRPYYGAVFYQNGVRYAGFYQTPGQLVQVYDTLQESINAQVVTPPSAILRQGTDISSNDPRLNIPGTPDQII